MEGVNLGSVWPLGFLLHLVHTVYLVDKSTWLTILKKLYFDTIKRSEDLLRLHVAYLVYVVLFVFLV